MQHTQNNILGKKGTRPTGLTETVKKVNFNVSSDFSCFLLIAFLVSVFVIRPEGETRMTPRRARALEAAPTLQRGLIKRAIEWGQTGAME